MDSLFQILSKINYIFFPVREWKIENCKFDDVFIHEPGEE